MEILASFQILTQIPAFIYTGKEISYKKDYMDENVNWLGIHK